MTEELRYDQICSYNAFLKDFYMTKFTFYFDVHRHLGRDFCVIKFAVYFAACTCHGRTLIYDVCSLLGCTDADIGHRRTSL